MSEAKVSVVIPCHNDGAYLRQAVESVLNQERVAASVEVVIVDDRSTDAATLEALNSLKDVHRGGRIVRNEGASGPAGARNFGISVAEGEWIAFLDADDMWLPNSLERRWKALKTYPDVDFISADFAVWEPHRLCTQKGVFQGHPVLGKMVQEGFALRKPLLLKRPVHQFLQHDVLAWTGTVMVKKSRLLSVGGFDERLRGPEDHHLWVRLAKATDLCFVPEVIALYRLRKDSLSHMEQPPGDGIAAYTLLRKDPQFRPYEHLIRKKLAFYFEQNVYYHRVRGETWSAVRSAVGALRCAPTVMRGYKNLFAAAVGRR